ncbi:MAG: protein kinase [Pyrinomonadaceae bacterium]
MKVCSVCGRCYDESVAFCTEENHPALSETHDGSLEMIAGYRLERLVETGVKIETYRARQLDSGQTCLIRILSATEYVDDYLREAKLAATLFHPSVVDTYEAGVLDDGKAYVVQEEADGRTMREFLNDLGLPELLSSVVIVRQISEALHALHLSGLRHGAIRPENIVLTSDRARGLFVRIQNPDFGGAVARSLISNKFLADSALDQLKYFSPGQCSGAETGPQTDVYSLGIVFYELLSGAPPFDAAKAVGLIQKHKSQPVPDIRINNFHLRMLVTHSLTEALQKQPRLRQSSANVLARQLRHIEQLATHVSTPPPAGVTPAWRPLPATPISASAGLPLSSADPLPVTPMRLEAPAPVRSDTLRTVQPVFTSAENESPESLETGCEPLAAATSYGEVIDEKETRDTEVAVPGEPSVEPSPTLAQEPIYRDPRPRPMSWKEKVQSVVSDFAPETSEAPATPIFDSVDRKILESRSTEIEAMQARAGAVPAPRIPKKIEWQTPDDDIPSEAAALQALAEEGRPEAEVIAVAAREKTIEAPGAEVKEAEVIEVPMAIPAKQEKLEASGVEKVPEEIAVEVPVFIETPVAIEAPAAEEEPTPVVFANAAPIVETILEETAVEVPVFIETPVAIEAPAAEEEPTPVVFANATPIVEKILEESAVDVPVVIETPVAIETPAPITKAPVVFTNSAPVEVPKALVVPAGLASIEDPFEESVVICENVAPVERLIEVKTRALAEESVAIEEPLVAEPEAPVLEIPKPKRAPGKKAASSRRSHVTSKVKTPEPALAGAAVKMPNPIVSDVRPDSKAAKPAARRSGLGFAVNLADLEEITIVRPPSKQIRVDWERVVERSGRPNAFPAQRPAARTDIGFSPTILGGATERKIAEKRRNDGMFSAFAGESEWSASGQYHSILLGVGIVALIGLFLFGFGSATRYLETSSSAGSMPPPAQTRQAASAVPLTETAVPPTKTAPKNSVKPSDETKPALEMPSAESRTATSVPEKPAATVKNNDAKAKPESSKPTKPAASPAKEKVPAKPASPKPIAVKTPAFPPPGKAKVSTRPRIVTNAKP